MDSRTRTLATEFIALLSLFAIVAWFCDELLVEKGVPFFRDLGTYSYPIKFSLAQSFQAGELGLWDRHMAAGFPLFAALQPGVFYPLSLLFYFLPFFDAIRWNFVIHFLIAASGGYYLCRRWQIPLYISLIGAILFSLGGTVVSLSNLLNHFQSAVWLPWIILCGERFFDRCSLTNFLILVLVLLCGLLAGSPEFYFFSLTLLLLDGIRCNGRKRLGWIALSLIFANLVVIAVGMVQFLPTLELLSQSRRDRPIPFPEATYWSLNPMSLLGLFLPDKEADNSVSLGVRLFFVKDVPFLLSHYLGALSILGISAWVYFCAWKERSAVLVLVVISVILAMGSFTPIYGWLFDYIPPFRVIRFPEKFFFIAYALLLFMTIKGLTALETSRNTRSNFPIVICAALFVVLSAVYVGCRLHPESLARYMQPQSSGQVMTAAKAANVGSFIFNLERQMGIVVALSLIYFCAMRRLLASTLQHTLLVMLVLFDLGSVHKPLQFLLDSDLVNKSQRILSSSDSGSGRLFYYPSGRNLHPSSLTILGQPTFTKAVALSFENLLPNSGVLHGFDYFQEIDALTRQPYNDFLDFINLLPAKNRGFLFRALNIRYVIAFQPLEIPGIRLMHYFPQNFSWLYEVEGAVPRVYVAHQPVYEPNEARKLRILSSPDFDPDQQVLLNEQVSPPADKFYSSNATIIRQSNSKVIIEATLNRSGTLVLTDSFYPGWKVFVDSKEERILRANYFFRAVQLAPGKHTIEFKYEPLSFAIGLAISLGSIITLCGIAIFLRCWRHRGSYGRLAALSQCPELSSQ